MKKYTLTGLITKTISMEVDANDLEEAMKKCYQEYDFDELDDASAIFIDDKILTDNNGEIYLCDIKNSDLINY